MSPFKSVCLEIQKWIGLSLNGYLAHPGGSTAQREKCFFF